MTNVVRFLAITFTALALVPAGAHLIELSNKLDLPPDKYLVVQRLYRGWALSGVLVVGALISTSALVFMVRERDGFIGAIVALACIVATQIVFWSVTYPINVATRNWTRLPSNWEALRMRWEFSHATSAMLTVAALFAATIAVLRSSGPS